jgi:flavorubredoxin
MTMLDGVAVNNHNAFPRRISDGFAWLGTCLETVFHQHQYHLHMGVYLLIGEKKSLLVDTGTPTYWPMISRQIEELLDGRTLDYVFPTHPEIPHSSALPNILRAYPNARALCDTRDYGLYYPDFIDQLVDVKPYETFDLGGGVEFEVLPALIKDLSNSLWGFEKKNKVLFVADGFSFLHRGNRPIDEDAGHLPGECTKLTSEFGERLNPHNATYLLQAALYWSRFIDVPKLFGPIDDLIQKYKPAYIAPAHGNLIDDVHEIAPLIRDMHQLTVDKAIGQRLHVAT